MTATNSPSTSQRWSPGYVIGATIVVLLVGAAFYLVYRFVGVFFILFVAVVLATALRPAIMWLQRWGIPPWLGVLLVYALIAVGTIGLAALLAPLLIDQVLNLLHNAPDYYADALDYLRSTNNALLRGIARQLPQTLPLNLEGTTALTGGIELSTVAQVVSVLRAIGWSMFGLIAMLIIIYFWILDRDQIVRSGVLLLPADRREDGRELWNTLEDKVGAFIRGQALLCLSIGIVSLIAFGLIGVPNALLLAVLAGIFEAVPYIGPIFTAVLAIVLTLAQAPDKILWVIIACVVIQQLENALLVPRIMDRAVGVNAVVTLLAITAFGSLLGIGGAIMAIPLAVVLQVLFQRMMQATQQPPAVDHTSRDEFAVLRYQAQDLATDLRNRTRDLPERADQTGLEEELEAVVVEVDQLLQAAASPGPGGAEPISQPLR